MSLDSHDEFFAKGVFGIAESEYNEPLLGKNVLISGESKSKDFIKFLFDDAGSQVFEKSDEKKTFDIILAFDDFQIEELQKVMEKDGLFICCNGKNGSFYGGEGFKAIRIINMGSNMNVK